MYALKRHATTSLSIGGENMDGKNILFYSNDKFNYLHRPRIKFKQYSISKSEVTAGKNQIAAANMNNLSLISSMDNPEVVMPRSYVIG